MLAALKAKIDAAVNRWHRRIGLFWLVFSALWMMLPAFQGVMSAKAYFILSGVVVVIFIYGRVTHQEGIVDD